MTETDKDRLFASPRETVGDFIFDAAVARVFPDMINRSVPGYRTLVEMIGLLAREYLQAGTRCYDLGCSLGAVSYAVAAASRDMALEIIALDRAPAMIDGLRQRLRDDPPGVPVRALCTDVREARIEQASLVVLNLTLQFIEPGGRLTLLRRVRRGLVPGGALILTEKVAGPVIEEQQRMELLHQGFKRAQGYSELEISQKRSALERVLLPDSVEIHRQRLRAAGFRGSLEWFRCLNFVSLLAWI